ncbi:MAG: dipeptidase [Gemmatimonadota bacterium]|nr:dipeptidase [Gemmatimonadota bacterium]
MNSIAPRLSWPASLLRLALAVLMVLWVDIAEAQPSDRDLARAKRILRQTPLVDGHNDLPWRIREDSVARGNVAAYDLRTKTPGHTDLKRLRAGIIGAQFWSVYIPGEYRDSGFARVQLEQIDIARRIIERYPDRFTLALTSADIRRIFKQGKIGSVIGMEGGHAIENSLGALRSFYDLGARYMTLTHNVTLDWADAALDSARHNGLTAFGDSVVREMNRLGMLVDLSHVSPATMSDALNVTAAPVIFSHSAARALVDVPRNVPDSILRRLPANGGVVMVTFVPPFVSRGVLQYEMSVRPTILQLRQQHGDDSVAIRRAIDAWRAANPAPRATLAQVADHIEHIRRVAGPDHVGIGGDFDGISETVEGLEDVASYPALFAELVRRGWSDADLKKLAGENVLRAFARAEVVSARLRKGRASSFRSPAPSVSPSKVMALPGADGRALRGDRKRGFRWPLRPGRMRP